MSGAAPTTGGYGDPEVGFDHYEVRSWVGWHHHMTLSMLALWYLVRERRRLGKRTPELTIPMVLFAIAELVRPNPAPYEEVARRINHHIARNETGRRQRWRAKGKVAPRKRVV